MSVNPTTWLYIRNGGKVAALDVFVKVHGIFQVRGADGGVGHDFGLVLEGVADVAILIALGSHGSVVNLVFIVEVGIPLSAVMPPGNASCHQHVRDAVLFSGGNGERSVRDVVIGVSVRAVTEVAGVVVVEQVVVAWIALRIHF